RNVKKTTPIAPNPATCHHRGFPHASTQSPAIATTVVNRDSSSPIQAAYALIRRFSGTANVVTQSNAYNSSENATLDRYSRSERRVQDSTPKHTTANSSIAQATVP